MEKLILNKKDIEDYQQNREPYLLIDHASEVTLELVQKDIKN